MTLRESRTGQYVGYCVSSLYPDGSAETVSLFVEEEHCLQGVGTALVTRALGWMDDCGAERKRVAAGDGNDETLTFYRRFGFYPRMTVPDQKIKTV